MLRQRQMDAILMANKWDCRDSGNPDRQQITSTLCDIQININITAEYAYHTEIF